MAEHDDWTAADDALVRRAMATLRTEVEAAPLPDVRFVKARGRALRRRRFLTVGAAAAAAVVVAGTVGYAVLGQDARPAPTPPATSGLPSTSATTASSLDQPGALPLLTEWTSSLGLTGTARLTPVKPFGPIECLASEPGTKVQQEEITLEPAFQGGQVRFAIGSGQDPETAAEGVASEISGCEAGPGFKVNALTDTNAGALYSYTAGDAGSGWFAVVQGPHDVALLQIVENDRPTSRFTPEQVEALADIAKERLTRYGSRAGSPTSTPSSTATGPKAIDEDMPVSGPDPKPSSKLFVAASQWTSPFFGKGAKAYAGPGALEGSTAIVECETDEQQAGVAGRVGVVSIRAGSGDANYVGKQRVRVFDDVQGYELAQADIQRVGQLVMAGCTSAGGNRTTAERGPVEGSYLLTTKVTNEATGTMYQYVGVTGMQTEGGVSVIVFHGTDDGQGFQGSKEQGFSELVRLMDLARQK